MSERLPARPDLTYLRRQGKKLLLGVRSGEPAALSRVRNSLPNPRKNSLNSRNHVFGLRDALLVIAREYGFPSWAKLKVDVTHGLRATEGIYDDALLSTADSVEGTQVNEANTLTASEGDQPMSAIININSSEPNLGTTLVSSLHALMQTVDHPEWSTARLQGVLGYAFHFEMKEDGGGVMHDNMDWGLALGFLSDLGQFRGFNANKHDTDVDLPALKREARDAVRASLEQGVPALAWQAMSVEQKESGNHAWCWSLIVGYDDANETYTVWHRAMPETYTVRYDAIGHADPVEWFNVRILEQPISADEKIHLTALQNAVTFANGTRYTDENFVRPNGKLTTPYGLAAYELWRKVFESEDIASQRPHWDALVLRARRRGAAAYVRELVDVFPDAADPLEAAAAHYDRELESLQPLYDLFDAEQEKETFTAEDRAEAGRLISEALMADRDAVARIEAALEILDAS